MRLVHRNPHQGRPVVAPTDVSRGLTAGSRGAFRRAPQPLVRVDPLVAHRGDLRGVPEHPGDERPAELGQLEFRARLVKA